MPALLAVGDAVTELAPRYPRGLENPKIREVRGWCLTFRTQVGAIIAISSQIRVAGGPDPQKEMEMVNRTQCS